VKGIEFELLGGQLIWAGIKELGYFSKTAIVTVDGFSTFPCKVSSLKYDWYK
jgi:hypothetical protein